jgi:hypothetical protein
VFLVVVSLFYSIRISELNNQVKALAQEIALLKVQLDPGSPHARDPSS